MADGEQENWVDWEPPRAAAEPAQRDWVDWQPPKAEAAPTQQDWADWQPAAEPKPQSQFMSGLRSAAKAVIPTTASVLGAIGAAPLGTPGGPPGMIVAGFGGAMVAGAAAQKAQDWVLEQFRGGPDIQEAINAKEHPWTTRIAGAAPSLLTLTPSTTGQQLISGIAPRLSALAERGVSAGVTSAGDVGMQLIHGEEFDPKSLAVSAATGFLAPRTRGWTAPVEQRGQQFARSLGIDVPHGTPGSKGAAGTAEEQPKPVEAPVGQEGKSAAGPEDYGKVAPVEEAAVPAERGINVGPDPTLASVFEAEAQRQPGETATGAPAERPPVEAVTEPPAEPAPRPAVEPAARAGDEVLRGPLTPREAIEQRAPGQTVEEALKARTAAAERARDDTISSEPITPAGGAGGGAGGPTSPVPPAGGVAAAGGPPPPSGGPPPVQPPAKPPIKPPFQPTLPPPPRFPFLQKLLRRYQETIQPETISELALKADAPTAQYKASLAGEHDRIISDTVPLQKKWNKIPEAEQHKFISDVENGRPVTPEHQADAKRVKEMLVEAHKLEAQAGSRAAYRENYFPHDWEPPAVGKIPILDYLKLALGDTGFQKARTIDLIEEGLKAGYKLRSNNPFDLVRARLISGADMRMQMELLGNWDKLGAAVETPHGGTLQKNGWLPITAPNGKQWMINPDVAPIWENGVKAYGLWADKGITGDAFRAWMGFKSVWVPIKLAASLFHPIHVLGINLASYLARSIDQALAGNFTGAVKSIGLSVSPRQPLGIRARAQSLLGEAARTPEGKYLVKLMEEGGHSPRLSEQLRIDAKERFEDAMQKNQLLKGAYHGTRLLIQKMQAPIFEQWIPHLKSAAYLRDAVALLERRPDLVDNEPMRKVALRAIAKSNDNRFGEMFYGGLFWNRYLKDASIGSFLSLGWNLGFSREFGGAAIEAATRPAGKLIPGMAPSATREVIRDATNKIKFASIYMGSSMLLGGMLTKVLSGEDPKELNDYIFPRVGGVNPDGSPRRITTMFYTREVPMAMKHIEEHGGGVAGTAKGLGEMLWSKMLFQPLKELWQNKSYFGSEIWDTNAPAFDQLKQAMQHVFTQQTSPMSVTGAQRAQETGGRPIETPLAFMGFGPAPKYAESSALQNRISHLYRTHVAPDARPYEDPDVTDTKRTARNQLLLAQQRGDDEAAENARKALIEAGQAPKSVRTIGGVAQGDQKMFKRLPQSDQIAILDQATKEERDRYWRYTSLKTKIQWNKDHPQQMSQ